MNNLLITGGTTSYAFRIMNLLSDKFIISLGTADDIPSVMNKHFIKLPSSTINSFVHEVLKIALENNITYILPIEEKEITLLSQSLSLFEEYGIQILIPNVDEIRNLNLTSAPHKNSRLTVLIGGVDLLNNNKTIFNFSGCGYITEANDEFILIAI